eukprot:1161928-Pelagomonas_calceolata.AAC.14
MQLFAPCCFTPQLLLNLLVHTFTPLKQEKFTWTEPSSRAGSSALQPCVPGRGTARITGWQETRVKDFAVDGEKNGVPHHATMWPSALERFRAMFLSAPVSMLSLPHHVLACHLLTSAQKCEMKCKERALS